MNNNEVIDKLTIQNELLLEKLEDTCFSFNVSYFHKVYCLEDSHDMMDHAKHEKLQVIDVLEDYSDDIQSLVMVEEELELPLEMVTQFLKKCIIPPPWNKPMRKFFHF